MALEKGPAGSYWHAVDDGAIAFREIADALASRLDLPAVSIPIDELVVPGYYGFLANIVTRNYPASNLITRQTLGWEPSQPASSPVWTTATTSPPADGRDPNHNESSTCQ